MKAMSMLLFGPTMDKSIRPISGLGRDRSIEEYKNTDKIQVATNLLYIMSVRKNELSDLYPVPAHTECH